jgi:hypothetical protein
MQLLGVGLLRIAVAEACGQFENKQEGECLQLEAVTRGQMKTQLIEKTIVKTVQIHKLLLVPIHKLLLLLVVACRKCKLIWLPI